MSLLLDALKKAAEKNAQKEQSASDDNATKVDFTEVVEKTVISDGTETLSENTNIAPPQEKTNAENITEFELAQIINAQKNQDSSLGDGTEEVSSQNEKQGYDEVVEDDVKLSELSLEDDETDLNIDPDPSLALFSEDDDPSLKLALSDEEILLTDDDVTEFLGSDELYSRLEEDGTMTGESNFIDDMDDDETELRLIDRTTTESLNLVDPPTEYTQSDNDTTYRPGHTSTTANNAQTTNLNNLTNDVTVNIQDRTSTETFASDNYDRTLVKLDGDVSKVFTGMKSVDSGAAMTPDFAKKVFVHKSTSLRKRNYKVYTLISLILLVIIGVFALFEMQTQIDDIDNSLVRLKRNPVPAELRFQKQDKQDDSSLAVLQGRVDTEALNLLKSLKEKTDSEEVHKDALNDALVSAHEEAENKGQKDESDEVVAVVSTRNNQVLANEESSKKEVVLKTKLDQSNKKSLVKKQKVTGSAKSVKKKAIEIETKTVVSKESIWLKDAYTAYEKGNIELASLNYSKVLEKNPSNRDALLGEAAIFTSQNRSNKAIDNYQAVLLENPKDSLAMASLITASTMSPIESESRLKLLQRESPKATYLQFALGNVISAQNRWQEAQQYYFMAYQSNPENPDYAYNLAVSLEQIDKSDVAVNYYEQAVHNAKNMSASFDVELTKQRIEVLSQ